MCPDQYCRPPESEACCRSQGPRCRNRFLLRYPLLGHHRDLVFLKAHHLRPLTGCFRHFIVHTSPTHGILPCGQCVPTILSIRPYRCTNCLFWGQSRLFLFHPRSPERLLHFSCSSCRNTSHPSLFLSVPVLLDDSSFSLMVLRIFPHMGFQFPLELPASSRAFVKYVYPFILSD